MRLTPGAAADARQTDKLDDLFNVAQSGGMVNACQDGGKGILLRLKDCPASLADRAYELIDKKPDGSLKLILNWE